MAKQLASTQVDATAGPETVALSTLVPKVDLSVVTFIFRNQGTTAAYVTVTGDSGESAIKIVDDDQPTIIGPYDGGRMPILTAPTGADVWVTPLIDYAP